jgi:hypothetical protein
MMTSKDFKNLLGSEKTAESALIAAFGFIEKGGKEEGRKKLARLTLRNLLKMRTATNRFIREVLKYK